VVVKLRLFIGIAIPLTLIILLPAESMAQQAEVIPYKTDDISIVGVILRTVFVLAFLIGMAIAGLWLVRKYVPTLGLDRFSQSSQRIKVLEVKRLTPRTVLFLVEVDGRTVLLGQGDQIFALDPQTGLDLKQPLAGSSKSK